MPFKTSDELKNFLSPTTYVCQKCQMVSKDLEESMKHDEFHRQQDELTELRKLQEKLAELNVKPDPNLKRLLEDKIKT